MDKIYTPPALRQAINYDIKKDKGKRRTDLIPTSVFKSLADVLTFGLTKYEENGLFHSEHLLFNAMAINHLTLDAAAKEQK